jgi:hypothetical protein
MFKAKTRATLPSGFLLPVAEVLEARQQKVCHALCCLQAVPHVSLLIIQSRFLTSAAFHNAGFLSLCARLAVALGCG